MSGRCPTCGQQWQPHQVDEQQKLAENVERMRAWCVERGHWVSYDGRVKEPTAAEIMGRAVLTLQGWRRNKGFPHVMVSGHATYRLQDLALAIEAQSDLANPSKG